MITASIVVPVYRSEDNLDELCKRLSGALNHIEHEIILVNDGSPDNSWNCIRRLQKENSRITGICLRKNFGQDNAIMAGLRHASGEYVVIMDDDLQHSPDDIPRLIDKCCEGYDVVYANFTHQFHSWWKRAGSWLNGKVAEILIHKPKDVYLSPYLAVCRSVVQEIIRYEGPYPYVQGLLFSVTKNFAQIDAEHYSRFSGHGNFNLVRSISVFLKLATSFSVIPLRIASITGFLVSLVGFILAPYYIYEYIVLDAVVEGWTTLVLISLIIGGLTLMSLGLIGEYLGRLYLTINNRPQYVISEIISGISRARH